MKKMLLAGLFLAVVVGMVAPVDAGLFLRRGGHASSSNCPTVAVDCCAPVSVIVGYKDEVVQGWKMEVKTKVVPTDVTRMVASTVDEVVTYKICKTVLVPEQRKCTTYQQVTREVPYTYTVCIPEMKQVVQKVTTYQQVTKEVPYTYTVQVPEVKQVVQKVTTYQCVPETVQSVVNVCRQVPVCSVDPCTGCLRTLCTTICEAVPRTCTVWKQVPVVKDVTVNVFTYKTEQREGKRLVCEIQPMVKDVTVSVCTYKTEERKGTRLVCEVQPVVKDITVNVCRTVWEDQKATVKRIVCNPVTEKVNVTHTYCEKVAYNYTVKVPVYGPPPPPMPCPEVPCAAAPCSDCSPCAVSTTTCGTRRLGCGCR